MMKLNLFATKLEENNTYIMKNIVKRIAAMGAAVMMMSSMAIGASAADSFSFYISNTGSVTSKVITAGNAAQDDYVRVN